MSRRKGSKTATPEVLARMDFEPMGDEVVEAIPTRESFLENAAHAYFTVALGVRLLTKDPAGLELVLQQTDGKNGGEAGMNVVGDLQNARDWLHGFVKTLDCVIARTVIVTSKIAMRPAP